MQGQWIGWLRGTTVILELDEIENKFRGHIQIHAQMVINSAKCSKVGYIEFDSKLQSGEVRTDLVDKAELGKSRAPYTANFGNHLITYKHHNDNLHIHLRAQPFYPSGNVHEQGNYELDLTNWSCAKTHYQASRMSWKEFKDYLDPDAWRERYIWRGQEDSDWLLRSSFHRYRAGLAEYVRLFLNRLHPTIASITKDKFDLSNDADQIAFLSLIQHHGYPTPFLDWSLSPYVAAFFAFRNSKAVSSDSKYARIFRFAFNEWAQLFDDPFELTFGPRQITMLKTIPIHNPRLAPQQAISVFANVADVESFVKCREKQYSKDFLSVIELPWSERPMIMKDLRSMGITAASLFPGLDGTCEAFKEEYFLKDQREFKMCPPATPPHSSHG
jgi:hypothetical protein